MLRTACSENKKWQDQYGIQTIISVNISPIQLRQKNFFELIKKILRETGLQAQYLELEITESVFIDSIDSTVKKLKQLRAIGIKISLDDFGTGFSSLNYLTKLPLDTVKIDKSFVQDIKYGTVEREIINSIISLVHNLKLEIVAEGVETKEQLQYLVDAKCDCFQGYLLSMPDKGSGIEKILDKGNFNLLNLLEYQYEGLDI